MKNPKKLINYTAVLERDPENGWYTVTVPAMPGCISQGRSFEEAISNIKEATALYTEVMSKKDIARIQNESSEVIITPLAFAI